MGGEKRASCSSWCRRPMWARLRSLGLVQPSTPACISSASLPAPPAGSAAGAPQVDPARLSLLGLPTWCPLPLLVRRHELVVM